MPTDTFLSVLAGATVDLSGLESQEVNSSTPLPVITVMPDSESPSLLSFELDLDQGELELTFNDVVDVDTLDPRRITLRSDLFTSLDEATYTLTGGTSPSENGFVITVRLSTVDLNAIKARTALAVNGTETYIELTPEAIDDVFGSPVVEIIGTDAIAAADVTRYHLPRAD